MGAFFSVFLPLLLCICFSLTHTISFLISLSRSLLLYSSFPSPLKVKCIREETSPGRGGSDPPRAAPRETRVCGCSQMLRERESGTFRTIFRLAIRNRDMESRECISSSLSPRTNSLLERLLSFFSSCAPNTSIYVTCFALSYRIFRTTNPSRKGITDNE